ncbi:DNA-binding transcriptional regulator, LysR family [Prosthecobacter debontii]|uniref:DNA-binding transcriptional regulator, LysR family n=1 Tax=Prosthecobacter debontii TaxID=48467 RepID=A0A1T4XHV6_9BACT|nr:LysR substrate-binding domain-containing protein [Prosthecobacter debontii]SKA89067.1 DNA-binding transcriptional regulator, LysR family [Prosthecobacter debontii]
MDLRHLRYFQAVAEELSFSRASRRLYIAQPALSRAVQELEHELGIRLIERDRRTVALTPAGTVLLHETALLLERFEESIRRVRRTALGEEGELRLGYIGPPTQRFLGRLLHDFRHRYPNVSVHLEERTPERVWEMVAKGRLSVALTRPLPGQGGRALETLLLRNEPLGIVVPKHHRLMQEEAVTWEMLAQESLIVLARREGVGLHDEILAACRAAGFTPKIAYSPSLMGTVLSYVEAGAGVGIATDSVAASSMPSALRFLPVTPEKTVPLVLVWNPEDDSPTVQAFRGLVSEWLSGGKLWQTMSD